MKKKEANNFFKELYSLIDQRAKSKKKNSYSNLLLKLGPKKIAQKIGEESNELIIDYLKGSNKRVIEETADLIYHIIMLLYSKKITIQDIENELKKRRKKNKDVWR